MKARLLLPLSLMALLLHGCCGDCKQTATQEPCKTAITWQEDFDATLPMLGHRNWVLVVDKSFPLQSAAGMRYINTGGELLDVTKEVLARIEASSHVKAIIYTDMELESVNEELAPGIDAYKSELSRLLGKYEVRTLDHEAIFAKLDAASKLFNILVLKTDMILPYSSVFMELDCGYWSTERETKLRELIQQKK